MGSLVKVGKCTGTLVAPDTVLTADHCKVLPGEILSLYSEGSQKSCQSASVSSVLPPPSNRKMLVPPGYIGPVQVPDLKLLKLSQPLCGKPIPVCKEGLDEASSWKVAGFGARGGSRIFPMSATLPQKIKSQNEFIGLVKWKETPDHQNAKKELEEFYQFYSEHNWITHPSRNKADFICSGDSGGPVYRSTGEDTCIGGIVMAGVLGFCDETTAGLYVSLGKWSNWIEESIKVRSPSTNKESVVPSESHKGQQ